MNLFLLSDLNGNIEFMINGLQSASMYQIKIYAKNSKGSSRHVQLKAETLRPAERLIDGSFNLDSVFASDSISGNEGFGQLSSNSDDTNALTNDASTNLDLADTNSNVLNSELLSARNTRSMFNFTNGKPMLLILLSSITMVSLIIVALGVAVILRVKRVHSNSSSSNSSLGGRNSNSNIQSINETSTNTVNTSCSTGELLGKGKVVSNKSNQSSPSNHHQYQMTNNLIHSNALNPNSTLNRQSQNQMLKRQSLTTNNTLLIHSTNSPKKLIQTNGQTNLITNTSTGILTTALPGITDDCCCEDEYCEELRMVSGVITEQQQQRALIAQHQLDQQQLYQSLLNSGKTPDLIPSFGGYSNYENTGKQYIAYGKYQMIA